MFGELGLAHTVTFTGGIPEKEKNDLLCRSRIGLSLSFEEGWGLSINEFLATGIPVGSDLDYADDLTVGKAIDGRREV